MQGINKAGAGSKQSILASQSEHQFIKALTPQFIKVDPQYKMNKPKLLRDIRILRTFYDGKISQEATNDVEQLRITLNKCKSTLANDIGDVALHEIQEYKESLPVNDIDNVQNQNALNLNVNMNLSPVKVNDHCINENIKPENSCYFAVDGKTKRHAKTKSGKHSRSRKRKRHKHAEQTSSLLSELEDSASTSSSDDEERGKTSKCTGKKYLKLKEKLQHYELRDKLTQAESADGGPMIAARDVSVSQMYPQRLNSFSSPELVQYRNNFQHSPSFPSAAYDFNSLATQVNPVAYNLNPYFKGAKTHYFLHAKTTHANTFWSSWRESKQ